MDAAVADFDDGIGERQQVLEVVAKERRSNVV
jgi:hypothetical protein